MALHGQQQDGAESGKHLYLGGSLFGAAHCLLLDFRICLFYSFPFFLIILAVSPLFETSFMLIPERKHNINKFERREDS
jgi:hypothetical protein